MRKNDFATLLAYAGMIAIALLVGIFVIRGIFDIWESPNKIILIIAMLVGAIIFNSVLLEVGHVLGAKAGHYTVYASCVFGIGYKKGKDGKKHMCFSGYEGLTGETRFAPKDIQKAKTSGIIALPLLFYMVEVIICVIMMALGDRFYIGASGTPVDKSMIWLKAMGVIFMAVGGMIFFYNYFPAHLDSETDGYRMVLLSKKINKEAYNQLLQNRYFNEMGLPMKEFPVYDDVTDYTAQVNMDHVYTELSKNNFGPAILIVQKTLDTEEHVSSATRNEAMAMKLSLVLLTTKRDVGLEYYENIENEDRRYLAEFFNAPSLRSYLLVSGVLEGSETETNFALAKAPKILKHVPASRKVVEEKLLELTVQRISTLHPSWKLVPWKEEPKKVSPKK